MTSTQCNLLNIKCPLSGKPVTQLENPVRRYSSFVQNSSKEILHVGEVNQHYPFLSFWDSTLLLLNISHFQDISISFLLLSFSFFSYVTLKGFNLVLQSCIGLLIPVLVNRWLSSVLLRTLGFVQVCYILLGQETFFLLNTQCWMFTLSLSLSQYGLQAYL